MRTPIMNTTKSPSRSAVIRSVRIMAFAQVSWSASRGRQAFHCKAACPTSDVHERQQLAGSVSSVLQLIADQRYRKGLMMVMSRASAHC